MGTIAVHAERDPNRVAVIVGNGDFVETFGELEAGFADAPLTVADLLVREAAFMRSKSAEREACQRDLAPVYDALTTAMGRFLAKFPDERADLQPSVRYLDSFLGLLQTIQSEDLPQYEQRFKERCSTGGCAELRKDQSLSAGAQ